MTVQDELLGTFEAVRLRAHNFCAFRNWEKFHLPASLALALSGENFPFHLISSFCELIFLK